MRGADRQTCAMFSYLSPEAMVPAGHPLRLIRPIVNAALERLSRDFDKLYAAGGRDSIAPEKLLRALLLQAFYSVRSERQRHLLQHAVPLVCWDVDGRGGVGRSGGVALDVGHRAGPYVSRPSLSRLRLIDQRLVV